jgi:exodeoxyribonuclease V beta subunit
MAVEETPPVPPRAEWTGRATGSSELSAAQFARAFDLRWRRNSYTGITAAAREDSIVASEPEERVKDDEHVAPLGVAEDPADTAGDEALHGEPVPLATMPGGTDIGTFVHSVLEDVDFASYDLRADVADAVQTHATRRAVELGGGDGERTGFEVVVDGLCRAIETPLGPLADGLALRNVTAEDRLNEMDFELPLVGGLNPRGGVTVRAIAHLLRRHLPAGDPLAPYAASLRDPTFALDLRGYLTGSIDVVLRLPGDQFVVADYKTNWLGTPDAPLTPWHYRPAALVGAMEHGHYPLQALLYSAALHRFLRWRVPGYSPERNLGGILYLFVRGMTGPDVPMFGADPCGVFAWRPPARLIVELSDLLDGVEAAA